MTQTVRVKTFSGEREEVWPPSVARAEEAIKDAKRKYEPLLASNHTLDLIGLQAAVADELKRRRPALEASMVHSDIKPKGVPLGNGTRP